jgi:2-phosphosulfolactate phosphatase
MNQSSKPTATTLEVLFAPAEFTTLPQRDLSQTVCVVFDILRATSSMITALGNGATAIAPVSDIPEALRLRQRHPDILLAGERAGLRIEAHLTGGVTFDLGNSPREFTAEKVAGRAIATTTTNGTRALRACAAASRTLVAAFLNLQATADFIARQAPPNLLIVCSGTFEEAAYEDVLGAGALCDLLWDTYGRGTVSDSAHMARQLYHLEQHDLLGGVSRARNGRALLAKPALREDVPFCAQRDLFSFVAQQDQDGLVRKQ